MSQNIVSQTLGDEVGKIIAVHLSYPSRAEQRGRIPAEASYFMKASSSLNGPGEVVRPDNAELLVFEAEIALVIGKPARNVSEEEAWQYVSHVTAANDMGILDLRPADKGSNVRSKSGDGMTPIGPKLIPADKINPRELRVKATVDGTVMQDDSSGTLLFPFEHFIADLSRVMTLEPGDIILTGTPAGSSVLQPGQSVTVEVYSESDPSLTSGELTTTVVSGPALADVGSAPAADDKQRIDAWGSREAAGLEPEFELTDELRERISNLALATLSSQMRQKGYPNVSIDGVRPQVPGTKLVGRARTLRYVGHRPDLFKKYGGGYNAQKRAIDTVNPGEVLVMEARGYEHAGTLGDILALRAKVRGAAGIITDGAVRDWAAVEEVGLPVFAQAAHPSVLGRVHIPWDTDVTITCGRVAVQPGDVIVGDDDGAIVIPPHMVEELVADAEQQESEEEFIAQMVAAGESVDGLYPLNAQWREKYNEWLAEQNDN
ncbi:fumarylacetoacetate hydrolase family protein [Trueperella bialowiezensis]|uniref:Homoprotocatechuate catabolism bifunctional isomerase/decarboxylase n=1 Tax=Trueperella bialowiezensis TaxID=312285 RepID=A0A448PEU4_9ACTO|nr:fumarylacetoacetate hydrolase family protein [Trueperella bialowiezensis]VEI13430.1 Homoprotocatechuate catabolism bifunctional isomerase/decarboxylase [Trueperella bialowiezensis]